MVSPLAKEDIEAMLADGLQPSVNDIVRLNALGLKLERSAFSAESLFCLPRVAYLGKLVFRQPTMGHEIWLDEVGQILDMGDPSTNLAATSYACSIMDADKLPDPHSKVKVTCALMRFKFAVRKHTIQQIVNATRYVIDGNDAELYEYPVQKDTGEGDMPDGDMSAPVGIILDGTASGIGISLADARRMTRTQYRQTVRRYLRVHGMLDEKAESGESGGEYFATLEAIRKRLESERKAEDGNGSK